MFAYGDAARYRLGVNHHQIPVNAARCPVHSFHRDGAMRVDGNYGGQLAYVPNSDDQWADQPDWREPPLKISGAAGHWDHRVDEDHFEQPGNLFRLMSESQKQALFENTARSLSGVSQQVQQRHVAHCTQADPFYGAGVSRALAEIGQ
ncbi:Catalase [compost metagenome]